MQRFNALSSCAAAFGCMALLATMPEAKAAGLGWQPGPHSDSAARPTVTPIKSLQLRGPTCKQQGKLRSVESKTPVEVTFVNKSGEYRAVLWIGFDGVPKDYGALDIGQSLTVKTFLTHPWMLTDGPGNCIEMFMPRAGTQTFELRVKSPGFGPE